jgi:flagellar biosynthetic protein FliO
MGRQKKIGLGSSTRPVAFGLPLLFLLLLVSGGWMALASRSSAESGLPASDDRVLPAPVTPPPTSFLSDSDPASSSKIHLESGELFFKMMLSVGLVLGLGAAAFYLSKRVLPRVARAPGKEIRILETAGLGPRKALHLVEVSGQRLLLASTSENVTLLTSLSEVWHGISSSDFCVGEPPDVSKPQLGEAVKT